MPIAESQILARHPLVQTLRREVANFPLVVLCAPMGYGKTTLVHEFSRRHECRCYTLCFQPGPHNIHHVWQKILSQLTAQGLVIASSFRDRGFPSTTGEIRTFIEQFKARLHTSPAVFILDDYHNTSSPQMDALVEAIVRENIPNLRIIISSRIKPNLHLEDLIIKGVAETFDKSLLTFSDEDTEALFALHGIRGVDVAKKAAEFSEGWAAAVWLSLRSYQEHGAIFAERNVESLLESSVYEPYSPEEKHLLLQLSIFDRFTPRQAVAVSTDSSAPRTLLELHEKNALLTYDYATDTYSLHTLFRNYLQKRLYEQSDALCRSIDLAGLLRRAAQWYEKDKEYVLAVTSYSSAGADEDYISILAIFEKLQGWLPDVFTPETVRAVEESLPLKACLARPIGYLALIHHFMTHIDRKEGALLLKKAELELRPANLAEEMQKRVKGELAALKALTAFNNLDKILDQIKVAYEILQGPSAILDRKHIWNFGCPSASYLYLQYPGEFERTARRTNTEPFYMELISNGCGAGAPELIQAELFLEQGKLSQVEAFAIKAAYRGSLKEQPMSVVCANFTLGRLLIAAGQPEKALTLLNDLQKQLGNEVDPLITTSITLGKSYLYTCLNIYEEIPSWVQEGRPPIMTGFYQGAPFTRMLCGKIMMLKRDWLRLEAYAKELPHLMKDCCHLFVSLHAKILQAVATYRLDGLKAGTPLILEALTLSRPDNIALTVAEYGKFVLPLLRYCYMQNPKDPYLRTTLRLAKSYAPYAQLQENAQMPGAHPLKDRERLLLILASEGKSNSEIAAHLDISEAAVKKSFSVIYRKLGVRKRVEAVQAYRALSSVHS